MGAAGITCHDHLWRSSYVWATRRDGKTETFSHKVQHPSSTRFSQNIHEGKDTTGRFGSRTPKGKHVGGFGAVFPSAGTGAWSQDGGNYEQFFTKKKIKVLERPSRSPDLNPIGKSVGWSEASLCTGDALDIWQIWSAFEIFFLGGRALYAELKVPFSALVSKYCQVKVGHADRDLPKNEKGALTKYLRACVLCNRVIFFFRPKGIAVLQSNSYSWNDVSWSQFISTGVWRLFISTVGLRVLFIYIQSGCEYVKFTCPDTSAPTCCMEKWKKMQSCS